LDLLLGSLLTPDEQDKSSEEQRAIMRERNPEFAEKYPHLLELAVDVSSPAYAESDEHYQEFNTMAAKGRLMVYEDLAETYPILSSIFNESAERKRADISDNPTYYTDDAKDQTSECQISGDLALIRLGKERLKALQAKGESATNGSTSSARTQFPISSSNQTTQAKKQTGI
jgi:hypothetical protein